MTKTTDASKHLGEHNIMLTHCGLMTAYGKRDLGHLMAPIHYLNQWWYIIGGVQWYSAEASFMGNVQGISHWDVFEN